MLAKDFPYDQFLKLKEEKEKELFRFLSGEKWTVPLIQRPAISGQYGALCNSREKSLETQLDFLASYLELKSDFIFSYLEPWHGVGVYASAFGCPLYWSDHADPQTHPIYMTEEEVAHFKAPDIDHCDVMHMVLDTIDYFRQQTGDMLDISLTDTQSPNDNASLIVDTCEFFVLSVTEPEALHPLMQAITDTMIQFSEMQMERLGPTLTSPGHLMLSSKGFKGISLSDDNMAVISPDSYANTALPYNQQLARHFGGLAIHTCGSFAHTANLLLQTEGLKMVDCAIGKFVDPNPNSPKKLKELFSDTGVVLKVRLGAGELDLLDDIIDKKVKLVVQLCTEGTVDEQNRQYDAAKKKIQETMEQG